MYKEFKRNSGEKSSAIDGHPPEACAIFRSNAAVLVLFFFLLLQCTSSCLAQAVIYIFYIS